jgi:hypothetical protein
MDLSATLILRKGKAFLLVGAKGAGFYSQKKVQIGQN